MGKCSYVSSTYERMRNRIPVLKNGIMFVRIEYLRENEKSDSRVKEWGNVCLSRGKNGKMVVRREHSREDV